MSKTITVTAEDIMKGKAYRDGPNNERISHNCPISLALTNAFGKQMSSSCGRFGDPYGKEERKELPTSARNFMSQFDSRLDDKLQPFTFEVEDSNGS
jgi:hypothetical protein